MIPTGFTGATIDRADNLRGDPAGMAAAIADPAARVLRLVELEPVAPHARLEWRAVERDDELVLLGLDMHGPRFAAVPPGVVTRGGSRSPELMGLLATLPREEAALFAAARSLVDWHARHRFCATCGGPTASFKGGWARRCERCEALHFPRTDPVVIMLAEHGGRALLGRGNGWGERRYSALAGFVEPGESIEEAVARELWEEAGIRVRNIRYVASQPWPFPSQLMIACLCDAEDDRLTIDHTELEDCFWATRKEVRAGLDGADDARFASPPAYAIARDLLSAWANAAG